MHGGEGLALAVGGGDKIRGENTVSRVWGKGVPKRAESCTESRAIN